jgi:hypothetical protein
MTAGRGSEAGFERVGGCVLSAVPLAWCRPVLWLRACGRRVPGWVAGCGSGAASGRAGRGLEGLGG